MDEETLKALAELPMKGSGARARQWSKDEDGALLKYWPVAQRQEDVARLLGVSEDTARNRYRLLKGRT